VLAIDPTARVAPTAVVGSGVEIGPYCVIGPNVTIGDGCKLVSHVSIQGRTTIGARTSIGPFASLGSPPQSVHYRGEDTALSIGEDCDFREHVTVNLGTAKGRGTTTIGHHAFMMTGAHVGHDCVVGNHVVFANNATLGGFVEVGDYVFMGGLCAIQQFTRIGERVMIGGCIGVMSDIIPYAIVIGGRGNRGRLAGLNRVGLKRGGFSFEEVRTLYGAYRALFFGPDKFAERLARVAEEYAGDPHVMRIIDFIRSGKRRLAMPRRQADQED
jgi:UDP-N-acetylglucosamine acyltransferase